MKKLIRYPTEIETVSKSIHEKIVRKKPYYLIDTCWDCEFHKPDIEHGEMGSRSYYGSECKNLPDERFKLQVSPDTGICEHCPLPNKEDLNLVKCNKRFCEGVLEPYEMIVLTWGDTGSFALSGTCPECNEEIRSADDLNIMNMKWCNVTP